ARSTQAGSEGAERPERAYGAPVSELADRRRLRGCVTSTAPASSTANTVAHPSPRPQAKTSAAGILQTAEKFSARQSTCLFTLARLAIQLSRAYHTVITAFSCVFGGSGF